MEELIKAFGLDWRLLLIQMFNFGLVLLVLWYYLYRPVIRKIDERQKRIHEGLESSKRAEQQLDDTKRNCDELLARANEEAEKLYNDGKKHAEEKKAEILKEAKERSERTLADAEEKGVEIKEQFLRESKEEIARMAMLSAEQVLRQRSGDTRKKDS